ncbi:hypothetical protein [Novosphingobium sp. Gsoil 351]|uniref:hypothetical protein n=1 Tax=Novosphingobium sp. Gsoil 351 TaxID=2675225 RepID=UPI0012B4D3AE|nr:hypothetical protein [Novosphingobium sp. Gsoil 351]QGN56091.1 hypothetical protein GKE62_17605 [Novosphingobium sp. Gsoil 351]
MKLRTLLFAGIGVLSLQPTPVLAGDRLLVDVSAGISASRNPFLQTGDNTAAAAAFIQADPQFQISDEVSTISLNGTFRLNHYLSRYGSDVSARGGLNVERHLSSATLLRARASAQVARTSALDFFTAVGSGQFDGTAPLILPDVTFAGSRSRTTVLNAGVGLDHELNERERVAFDLDVTTSQFSQAGQSDYRFASANFDYRRAVSERTSAFAALRVGYSDYLGGRLDDGTILEPTVGIATQLNSRLSLEAGIGVSLSRVNVLNGRKDSRLVPSAHLTLCERLVDSKGCISASRGSQPTALSGLTTVTTVGFNYSRPISQRDQLVASANYTRTDRPSMLRASPGSDLLTASATYDRTISPRFAVFLTPSYARIFDSGLSRRADLAVRVGLRYRFGSQG